MKVHLGVISDRIGAASQPPMPTAQAFRVLQSNLQFMGMGLSAKSILVTSATPGEGKSTTAASLAVDFAKTGASVCLVDADLRRPTVSKLFGCANWQGLTTVLMGHAGIDDVVRPTSVSGLWVMPSGPISPNPSELLGSGRMANVLAYLQETHDVVLLDTPAVLSTTDAAVLAPKVGGVVLVTRSGQVEPQQENWAKNALAAVEANLLGVMLSAVPAESRAEFHSYFGEITKSAPARGNGWFGRLRRLFQPI